MAHNAAASVAVLFLLGSTAFWIFGSNLGSVSDWFWLSSGPFFDRIVLF